MARVVCSIWNKFAVYKFNMAEAAAPQDERSTGTRQRGFRRAEEKKPSHARRKRPPRRLSQRPNDIYVTRKSDFGAQLARCSKLLDQGCSELYIHGLGAAIHRAINLALQLKATSSHTLEVSATTSTVELFDDLEPLDDEADYQTQSRHNSAIHIRLYKTQVYSPPATTTSTAAATSPTAATSSSGSGASSRNRT